MPKEFIPLLIAALRANGFDDEGYLSSALSKTAPDISEAVPLIAGTHNAFWYEGKQRRIDEALQRISSPEARSRARVLRAKRTAALMLVTLPIVTLYGWILFRAYRRLLSARPATQYVLIPGLNYAAFVAVGLSSMGIREVVASFGFPGTPLVQLPGLLLWSPMILLYAFPMFAATALLSWGLIGGVPLVRKSRPVGRGEAALSMVSLAIFTGLVAYMMWSKKFLLPLPPPI